MGQAVGDDLKVDYKLITKNRFICSIWRFYNLYDKYYYKIIKIACRLNFHILLIIKYQIYILF